MDPTLHSTRERYDQISLHDAPVTAIETRDDTIVIATRFAKLGADHPSNPRGRVAIVRDCTLTLHGCTASTARRYDDARGAFEPHPTPARPLDGAIVNDDFTARDDGSMVFCFGGFDGGAWVEWTIVARAFTLAWASRVEVWA